jgi:hypothetical protein
MRRFYLFALAILLVFPIAAKAASPINQPDLISFSAGYFDFDKTEPQKQATDFRLEYRWGLSLLPLIDPSLRTWDSDVQFHPFVGVETNTYTATYGLGGYAMDWYISRHFVFTWSEGCGFFYRGDGARMGSFFQFRSEAEFGYRFNNNMRVTGEFSHISDAKITNLNPGAEIIGVYLHVPTDMIFGK